MYLEDSQVDDMSIVNILKSVFLPRANLFPVLLCVWGARAYRCHMDQRITGSAGMVTHWPLPFAQTRAGPCVSPDELTSRQFSFILSLTVYLNLSLSHPWVMLSESHYFSCQHRPGKEH